MNSWNCVFAASAITTICCASLHAVLKSAHRSECIDRFLGPSGSIVRPTAIACIVAAALSLLANTALVLKMRFKGARAITAAICSKWQTVFFMAVSAQRIVLRAYVISSVNACPLNAEDGVQIGAATLMWDGTIFMTGLLTIAADMEGDFVPYKRRCAYFVLALCLCIDTIGSSIMGNAMASQLSVYVGSLNLVFDNEMTSTIISQLIIALHFLFVSCRSRGGRGWAYAALKFELDECGKVMLSKPDLPEINPTFNGSEKIASAAAAKPILESKGGTRVEQNEAAAALSAFRRLCQHILRFQNRHLLRCRAFVIPCVAVHDVAEGADIGFAMARPAFDLIFLRPLQRHADAHPKFYFSFLFFFLAVPSIACELMQEYNSAVGAATICLTSCMVIMLLGYLSSRRYGLDRVAVKHVVSSFRFATLGLLCACYIALNIRRVSFNEIHATTAATTVIFCLLFLGFLLLDCSVSAFLSCTVVTF
jgi:hypothetical protein